jgi:hypothetical protein
MMILILTSEESVCLLLRMSRVNDIAVAIDAVKSSCEQRRKKILVEKYSSWPACADFRVPAGKTGCRKKFELFLCLALQIQWLWLWLWLWLVVALLLQWLPSTGCAFLTQIPASIEGCCVPSWSSRFQKHSELSTRSTQIKWLLLAVANWHIP